MLLITFNACFANPVENSLTKWQSMYEMAEKIIASELAMSKWLDRKFLRPREQNEIEDYGQMFTNLDTVFY